MPEDERVSELIQRAYQRFSGDRQGQVSQVYLALARAEPELFGIAMVGTDGRVTETGDALHPFTIMSVSKPFVFALICDQGDRPARANRSV